MLSNPLGSSNTKTPRPRVISRRLPNWKQAIGGDEFGTVLSANCDALTAPRLRANLKSRSRLLNQRGG